MRGHGGALVLAPLDDGLGHLVGQRVRPHRVVQSVHWEALRLEVRRGDLALELVRAVDIEVVNELHGVLLRITLGGKPAVGLRQLHGKERHDQGVVRVDSVVSQSQISKQHLRSRNLTTSLN